LAIETYQQARHGTNWLTRQYLNVMQQASDDPTLNFALHAIVRLTEIYTRECHWFPRLLA
jgi:hypothetical protein